MFASIVLDKDPTQLSEIPALAKAWLQNAGSVSGLLLLFFTLTALVRGRQAAGKHTEVGAKLLALALIFPPAAFVLWLLLTRKGKWLPSEKAMQLPFLYLGSTLAILFFECFVVARLAAPLSPVSERFLALGGLVSIIMVVLPMLGTAGLSMRWGRIWALAKLSLKEASRKKVLLTIFIIMALIFLFFPWFLKYKQEDQVRNYVGVIYLAMSVLFIVMVSVLGAFSLPTDIKSQSIHTIVTKPVEKLEIVLGKFLGYGILVTLGLALMAVLSYGYLLRGITPEAREESFKARVPIFGNLYFFGTRGQTKTQEADSVGREWGYRSYVSGPHPSNPNQPKQFAIWEFDDLPASLADQTEPVTFEYTFDIFRLSKGEGKGGLFCTFTFMDGRKNIAQVESLHQDWSERRDKLLSQPGKKIEDVQDALLSEECYFEKGGQSVVDYHTQKVQVPPALFKKLRELEQKNPRQGEPGQRPALLTVLVNIDRISGAQMLGVARHDMYLLAAEQPFWQNFFKGLIGMWFSFLLVLGIAIACSTYLSGVISWLVTLFLFGAGFFNEYIRALAEGKAIGGGPFEAFTRIAKRAPITAPMDPTPVSSFVQGADDFYRWGLRLFTHIIPDVNRFDLQTYVANGFDISWTQVLFLDNFVYLAGYLLPWLVLSYFLLKFREIANPT